MAIVLLNQASTELARSFLRDISNENDIYYFYVARTQVWKDEENVENPIDSVSYINESRKNILMIKRIIESDAALMINRHDWTSGTVYDQYDDRYGETVTIGDITSTIIASSGVARLADARFYVMTSEFNVYKCLDNAGGAPSTKQPTGQTLTPIKTEDGYIWKFMFQVGEADRIRFLTPDYIPVRKMSGVGVPFFDVNGIVDDIIVEEPGSGYVVPPSVLIHGDGQGATAHALVDGGQVTDIIIDNAGDGYTFAYVTLVRADGDPGNGATARVVLGGKESSTAQELVEASAVKGTIDRIDMYTPGIDYIDGDVSISIVGDGQDAEAVAKVDLDGRIIGIEVTEPGSGYTFAEIVVQNGIGVGTGATARAIISPYYGHGGNPPRELYADKLCISVNLDNETSDYFYNNDFRQIGIIKNPGIYEDDNSIYMDITGTSLHKLTVPSEQFQYYDYDDIITSNVGGRYVVVQKNEADSTIYLLHEIDNLQIDNVLTNITKGHTNLTINTIVEPEVNTKIGTIIYIDNRLNIVRQQDQVEKIRTILQF